MYRGAKCCNTCRPLESPPQVDLDVRLRSICGVSEQVCSLSTGEMRCEGFALEIQCKRRETPKLGESCEPGHVEAEDHSVGLRLLRLG